MKVLKFCLFLRGMIEWLYSGKESAEPPSYSAAGIDPTRLYKYKSVFRTLRVKEIYKQAIKHIKR